MQIVFLNDFARITGGVEKIAILSARALALKGYKVIFFSAVGPVDVALKNVENLTVICLQQVDILHDKKWRAVLRGCWNFSAAVKLRNVLETLDTKDTVVHVHAISKALTFSCVRMVIKFKFKILYHLHEYGIVCPNLGFFNYVKQKNCMLDPLSWKCIKSNCDKRNYLQKIWRCFRHWIQFHFGLSPSNIRYFAYVSKFSIQILRKYLGENKKFYFLENPIEMKQRERVNVSNNKLYIFIGRLSKEKNPLIVAQAAEDLQLPILFVGSGELEKEIEKICPHAIITGWVNNEAVEEYLKCARCLIFSSAWYETQGLVVAEAASQGVPAIVSDSCASREYINDGDNGLIFINQDLISLKEKIALMQDDKFVNRVGENAYEEFSLRFSDMDTYVFKLIETYRNVLEE